MPEIPHWTRAGTRERVLRTLTSTEAAEIGRWHSEQGDYRTAAVWHQLAAAIAATDVRAIDKGRCYIADPNLSCPGVEVCDRSSLACGLRNPIAEPTQEVSTLGSPQAMSHAPTTCVHQISWPQTDGPPTVGPCGEVIRWEFAPGSNAAEDGGWVHVGDERLGPHGHPATPGPVPPPTRRLDG